MTLLPAYNATILVAEDEDEMVGFCRLALIERRRFEITHLGVMPHRRHEGIGTALLAEVLQVSKKWDKARPFTWIPDNLEGIAEILEKAGYHRAAQFRVYEAKAGDR